MNLKEPQIEIDTKEPFKNCKLNRKQYADVLESIVSNAPNGCVIAINGAWGTGKTTFVRMWEQQLKNDGYKTAYFNAWETDVVSDPIVALIGKLHSVLEGSAEIEFDNVIKAGQKFIAGAIPVIVKAFLKKYELDFLVDAAKELSENTSLGLSEEIDQYKEECENLNSFRNALSNWVKTLDSDKPLVFFIDELDRCNPHYAVRLLERVKHLFSLSRIVFVLCIDKEQLGHSICGYYGSDNINAQEYLRRFIDVDYYLPEPDYDKFVDFLYSELKFDDIVSQEKNMPEEFSTKRHFTRTTTHLFKSGNVTLRLMEKMLICARLSIQTFQGLDHVSVGAFILLIYLRQLYPQIYQKIRRHEYDIQTMVNDFEESMPSLFQPMQGDKDSDQAVYNITFIFVNLLVMYNYNEAGCGKGILYEGTTQDDIKALFKTSILKMETVKDALWFNKDIIHRNYDVLKDTLDHIELLYELQPEAR